MTTPSIYEYQAKSIDGQMINMSDFKGKKMMIVNTASKCGFTPQYEALQKLHQTHGDKLVILGFPSGNFLRQEFKTEDKIAQFCKARFGVTFQLFSKVSVKGKLQHPIFKWLSTKALNGTNNKAPSWNFCKYLINEDGQVEKFLGSRVDPMGKEVLSFVSK